VLSKILGNFLNRNKPVVEASEPVNIQNLPKHEQARHLVDMLAGREGLPFNPMKAARVELHSINSNILGLMTRINQYAEKLELGQGLVPSDCFAELKVVTLDEFFTDEQGMYIPMSTLTEFVESCRRLFIVIERGIERKNRDVDYAVRLMGKCFTSIINVCTAVEVAGQ
jgi:hypothetical protein